MGMMKRYLMEKIAEFAIKIGVTEEAIYNDDFLYERATAYAQLKLQQEGIDETFRKIA